MVTVIACSLVRDCQPTVLRIAFLKTGGVDHSSAFFVTPFALAATYVTFMSFFSLEKFCFVSQM